MGTKNNTCSQLCNAVFILLLHTLDQLFLIFLTLDTLFLKILVLGSPVCTTSFVGCAGEVAPRKYLDEKVERVTLL